MIRSSEEFKRAYWTPVFKDEWISKWTPPNRHIKDEEEVRQTGIEDVLYSGSYCFVEWPDKAPEIFPPDTLRIDLTIMPDLSRRIKLESASEV